MLYWMGQHLNLPWKEEISLRLATVIRNFFNKKNLVPFRLPWKEVPSTAHQDTNSDCFNNYASKQKWEEHLKKNCPRYQGWDD